MARFSLWLLCLVFPLPLYAVVEENITAEQLKIFQSLSQDQQQELIKQYRSKTSRSSDKGKTDTDELSPDVVTRVKADRLAKDHLQKDILKKDLLQKDLLKKDSLLSDDDWEMYSNDISESDDHEDEVKPFGYDLFSGIPNTFIPATEIPVPSDYVIGPGDVIQVQLFGKENFEYSLTVKRDGTLNFPNIGVISVVGLSFDEVKQLIRGKVKQQFIGVTADVTLGVLRSIRVFVLGDANWPGSYTVSSLSTITNALFVSGGINTIGSLRNIQLKRAGKLVTVLDLYDLLLNGDTSGDQRLQPGDVIFIPPRGATVTVKGEFLRPAIYELNGQGNVSDLIKFAGGFLPSASKENVHLSRITSAEEKTVLDLNLSKPEDLALELTDGDVLDVPAVYDAMNGIVVVQGHVNRPGNYQWKKGQRISDLISYKDLKPDADLDYSLVLREVGREKNIKPLSVNLKVALDNPDSSDNIALSSQDTLIIFSRLDEREDQLSDVIEKLNIQADKILPMQIVKLGGQIRHPGEYPLVDEMRVSDLIRAGGGLLESAYDLQAELTRYHVTNGVYREVEHLPIELPKLMAGDLSADLVLLPHDFVTIKKLPKWGRQYSVEILGEIQFPGVYQIREGETLIDVINRAGGLTGEAYPDGAIFTREELKQKEQENIDQLASSLEFDLAALAAERSSKGGESASAVSSLQGMLTSLRGTEAMGRLVIDLSELLDKKRKDENLLLKDGDKLIIPSKKQEVTVIGEVFFPTSHLFDKSVSLDKYINLSGGLTKRADEERIYIVRANGAVEKADQGWFKSQGVMPGDTIVVPLDTDSFSKLQLWTNVSQIVYQLGIAAASWKTVGLF